MVSPVSSSILRHGAIFGTSQNWLDECVVILGAIDFQLVAKTENLSRTERSSRQNVSQNFGTVVIRGYLSSNPTSIIFVDEKEDDGFNRQGLIAIGLDE